MLLSLTLENLGPAPTLTAEFASRLNLVTGDNGLGKTLLLDAAWFGLTRSWPTGKQPLPNSGYPGSMTWKFRRDKDATKISYERDKEIWRWPKGRPVKPGLVVYAKVDGSFAVWDSIRNDKATDRDTENPFAGKPLHLSPEAVWMGCDPCLGLMLDWENWRLSQNGAWTLFCAVLRGFSLNEGLGAETFVPLPAERLQVSDTRPTPFLELPYGRVPITQISAGMRRVLSLAYVLVWTWLRNKEDAKLLGKEPATDLTLLWDEVEAHLHPQWQRLMLPSLLDVVQQILFRDAGTSVQILATTHAPLVLSSMETHWDHEVDRMYVFAFNTASKQSALKIMPYTKFGDASRWLSSPAFGLDSGYSSEAETAMQAADDYMAGGEYRDKLPEWLNTPDSINKELEHTLDESAPYWRFWRPFFLQQKK